MRVAGATRVQLHYAAQHASQLVRLMLVCHTLGLLLVYKRRGAEARVQRSHPLDAGGTVAGPDGPLASAVVLVPLSCCNGGRWACGRCLAGDDAEGVAPRRGRAGAGAGAAAAAAAAAAAGLSCCCEGGARGECCWKRAA
eukprot:1160623-Pelagomonas_calceolata.AAC.1